LEEFGNGKGKLAKASEEGQGPHRTVEPMMMMMVFCIFSAQSDERTNTYF
jgi:hypothetical protein